LSSGPVTSSVSSSAAQLSTFLRGSVAAVVKLSRVSVHCRRGGAGGRRAADTPTEAARDAVTPARSGLPPLTTVDSRLMSSLRTVDVPLRHVRRTGVVLRLTVETLATGQQTQHTA